MLRRIYALNYADAFIAGIVTVALPVIMLERGVDLEAIGLVLAVAPVVKLAVRLASSAMADRVGERLFYSLNAASNLAQAIFYALGSTLGFAVGKLFDGARESFIFAVNRTSILAFSPHKEHHGTAQLISGRLLANAGGSLAVFFLMPAGGFESLLALIALLSLGSLYLSRKIPNTHQGKSVKFGLDDLFMVGRGRRFYETVGAMVAGSAFYFVMFYIALPIFFKFRGFSLHEIGFMYAAYLLLFGGILWAFSRRGVSAIHAAMVGGLVFAIALFGMGAAQKDMLPYVFLFMAIGDACLALLWEKIIYLEARKSKNVSTDIALLHLPSGVVNIFTSAASGFIILNFGFSAIFGLAAITLLGYAAWCARLSYMKD